MSLSLSPSLSTLMSTPPLNIRPRLCVGLTLAWTLRQPDAERTLSVKTVSPQGPPQLIFKPWILLLILHTFQVLVFGPPHPSPALSTLTHSKPSNLVSEPFESFSSFCTPSQLFRHVLKHYNMLSN